MAKITEIKSTNNFTEIDESINKIKQIVESKTVLTKTRFFFKDIQKLDNLLKNNNLLTQFREREVARKKKEELHKKQVREKLTRIETFIGQGKLDEVKPLIGQIQKEIKNSYNNELKRLNEAQRKLKEKEFQILKKQQEEAQRKRDEDAKRLREIEERRQEELRKQREIEEKQQREKQVINRLLNKKTDWQAFQQVLQQNNITSLYHFTDQANIKSIKEHGGLYSWHYCDRNGIIIPYQGGGSLSRDLDKRYSLQDYVRISFTRNHPMMFVAQNEGRIKNPVVLTIDLDVCYFQETRFADMNATKTGHSQGKNLEDLKAIHFRTVKQPNHFNLDELEKPYFQAEVLVKTWIPIEYITNINNF